MRGLDALEADERLSSRCVPAERGQYLTDGSRLFRVVAPIDPSTGVNDAVLEDCATLAWRIYSRTQLFCLRLRGVGAGGRQAG